jgi:hypothetical protein
MSVHHLSDLGWKIHDLMRVSKSRHWLLEQCNKHLATRWEPDWRASAFSPDGSVAPYLTLVEKATALVAVWEIACPGEQQLGPTQYPDWKQTHETREHGIRWGIVVNATKEGLQSEHRCHIENWLKDVDLALREVGIATRAANVPLPPPPGAEERKGGGSDRATQLRDMTLSVRQAYCAFNYAESKSGKRLEDREAYDLLHDEGIPDDKGNLGELSDYDLPSFDTWCRQLRVARQILGEQKYTRRAGRQLGKSIVKGDQIERRELSDD